MNLVPRTREEISAKIKEFSPNVAIIEEFKKMNVYAVELQGYPQKDAQGCTSSFGATCRKMNCGVKAKLIDGKPYLINEGVK